MKTPQEIYLDSLPTGIKAEKTICQNCNNIVQRNNYCEVCDCKLP